MKLKVLSLFSGIGAFEKALERNNIDYELVNYCDIDLAAAKSFSIIHNVSEDLNLVDITKIDISKLPDDLDLITHGSPCQDFSAAGRQAGGDKGTGTRSSLMWNTVEIIENKKPKYVIWENVKNLISDRHRHNFDAYIETMDKLGYNSYYQVLNAKDYGVPQNRERIYTISIRKDIDDHKFKFPKPMYLEKRLKDILEENVDEKYFVNDNRVGYYILNNGKNLNPGGRGMSGHVSKSDICPTLTTVDGGGVNIDIKKATQSIPSALFDNTVKKNDIPDINSYSEKDRLNIKNKDEKRKDIISEFRIRKLTPLECWRLMGFDDEDYYKCEKICSPSQLYHQAGNSIVVNVLQEIYKNLFLKGEDN